MKKLHTILAALTLATAANAQIGAPYIHDPSTLAECDGKYYTFGTGGGGLISEDGWSWNSGAERPGGGAAPDVMKIGDRYLCIYGATGGGLGGGHAGRILTMWNKTLDPKSPDFKWSEAVEVCYSDGMEDQDAIDPSLLLDPTTGRLWVSYESERRGYALELAVDFVRMQQERQGWFNRNQMQQPVKPIANQTLQEVIGTWPEGHIPARIGDYMFRPHQRWTVVPVDSAGGYLSAPYFKIVIEGTERTLAATADKEVTTVPAYTGDDSQLWRIEQLTDGTYRIMPKAIPGIEGVNTTYCLCSAGDSTPTLARYDFSSDNSKWNFRHH